MKTHHQTIFGIIIATAVIAFWRGLWGLFDMYLFPSNPVSRFATLVALGLLILIGTHKISKAFV